MAVVVVAALALHGAVAVHKAAGLLEHDEAISLLAAAGKSEPMARLCADPEALCLLRAGDLQDFLRPTREATVADVLHSLARVDTHPPLYFVNLHALGKLDGGAIVPERLFGTLMFLLAAWCANRWIWSQASPAAKLLATAWLLLTPAVVDIATELRQYGLVYLGVLLAVAAITRFAEEAPGARTTFIILTISPLILLWSQYGTIVWIALSLLVLLACLGARRGRGWRMLAGATAAAGALLVPLLWWSSQTRVTFRSALMGPLTNLYSDGLLPLCRGMMAAWLPVPWRWQNTWALPALAAALLLAVALLVDLRRRSIDRRLWLAAACWGAMWFALLAVGRIPEHAVETKQLAPLVMVPVCLLARAGSTGRPAWVRWSAIGLLAISLLAQTPRLWSLLNGPGAEESRLIAALRGANGVLVDAPRRGYLLPLAEKMAPEARLVVAGPEAALARWADLAGQLPDDRLLLAEINSSPGAARTAPMQQLIDRLSAMYRQRVVLREGPRRTVTEFKEKLLAVSH